MTTQEKVQLETIKQLLMQVIDTNPKLASYQKQMAKDNLEIASQKTDWVVDLMRMLGWWK